MLVWQVLHEVMIIKSLAGLFCILTLMLSKSLCVAMQQHDNMFKDAGMQITRDS